ncbi:MAG: DUF192 domain-containing protein [Sphingopyxis sp.]|nr:DUF192 domain-containing protein [Sphingopyxis sp.]
MTALTQHSHRSTFSAWFATAVRACTLMVGAAMLAACSGSGDGGIPGATAHPESGLPVVPLTITHQGRTHRFSVEVARTTQEQARGLMGRTALGPDAGMIFPFEPEKYASFWMKDTLIPLDMLFVRRDGTLDRIAENTVPESLEPVASGGEVAAVLELAGGTAARLGIDESAVVRWRGDRGPQAGQP